MAYGLKACSCHPLNNKLKTFFHGHISMNMFARPFFSESPVAVEIEIHAM